jgi:hypothetical protein
MFLNLVPLYNNRLINQILISTNRIHCYLR